MIKFLFLTLLLTSCVTAEQRYNPTVTEVLNCDEDPDFDARWCVVMLSDGRTAGVQTWDIKMGDEVICVERAVLTCMKVSE